MAFSWVITALLFSLVLSHVEASSGQQALVHGSVSCLDCKDNYKLQGVQVLVGCDGVKKTAMAVTDENGHFKTGLPQDSSSKSSTKCLAKLLGGPTQLCSSRKTLVSNVVAADREDKKSFTTATPLAVYTTCPTVIEAKTQSLPLDFGSSNVLGVPAEWGFPPVSAYIPVMPIIGIP